MPSQAQHHCPRVKAASLKPEESLFIHLSARRKELQTTKKAPHGTLLVFARTLSPKLLPFGIPELRPYLINLDTVVVL